MTTTLPGFEEIGATASFAIPSLGAVIAGGESILIVTSNPRADGQVVEQQWQVPMRTAESLAIAALFSSLFGRGAATAVGEPVVRPATEADRYVSIDELLLAQVEASFPTDEQVVAEDELRERLTAEGIAHGNF